jgi:hypothetical protein
MAAILATFTLLLAAIGCNQAATGSAPAPTFPAATASPLPTPSPDVPVIYFDRPPSDAWQVVDWNGTLHGVLPVPGIGTPQQSPDGSRLLWPSQSDYEFMDRRGQPLAIPDLSTNRGMTWADDSSGICTVDYVTELGHSYRLNFRPATGGSRNIATFSTPVGPDVAACSPTSGVVVVTTASGYKDHATQLHRTTFGELLVIDFTNGKVLRRQSFPSRGASVVTTVVVSHDGSLAALATQSTTTVVNLKSGQTVAHFRNVIPLTFSWDGSLLAGQTNTNQGELVSSATGHVVWRDTEAGRVTQSAAPNPGGSEVMFLVTRGELDDLLVVAPSGATRIVARDAFLGSLVPCADCSAF